MVNQRRRNARRRKNGGREAHQPLRHDDKRPLLLIDSEVFTRFHLHLNPVVWELVINPDQNETARDWQLMFISVPIILLIEAKKSAATGFA